MNRTSPLCFVILAACATPAQESTPPAEPAAFSKDELHDFLSDKTCPLSKGALYFHEDGVMDALWEGEEETSTWETTDDSSFCYDLDMFGGFECIGFYKNTDGTYTQKFGDRTRILAADEIKTGKQS